MRPPPGRPLRALYYTNGGAAKNDPGFLEIVKLAPEVDFRAIGRAEHLPDLPNLRVLPWCDAIEEQFAWSDVVVNTSTTEGSPNFCMQALAYGRPVVAFANSGVVDLREFCDEGLVVVRMGDAAALVAELQRLRIDPPDVKAHLPTLAEVVAEWHDLLGKLADRRSPIGVRG